MSAKNIIEESKFRDVLDAVKRGEDGARKRLAEFTFQDLGLNGEMVRRLEERVKQDDTEAMWKLGLCKEYGMGTKQNPKEAEALYEESSDGGNPIGFILAWNGVEGSEEKEDYEGGEEEKEYDEDEDYYDDSSDDFDDEVLDRIQLANQKQDGHGWCHPIKRLNKFGFNYSKAKTLH